MIMQKIYAFVGELQMELGDAGTYIYLQCQ